MNTRTEINFEKAPESLWIASTPSTNYPALDRDIKIDVAIIGGGATGIANGFMLTNAGVKTCVLEADHILQGTTGHTTAKITSQHGLIYSKIEASFSKEFAQQYADANEAAIKLFTQTIQQYQINCDFSSQSAYIYTLEDKFVPQISTEVDTTTSLGIKASYLNKIPLDIPIKAAIRFDNQGQFHPRKFLLTLAKIISDGGTQIYEQTRIVNLQQNATHYVLTTNKGNKITANKVIIASHYPFYNLDGFYTARLYATKSYALAIKAKEDFPGGLYITAEEPGHSLRSHPYNGSELILVVGEGHKTGIGRDMVRHYAALLDYAHQLYTVQDVPYRWSTQDCMTQDDIPYIGQFAANTPNLYLATGYKKWGITTSMVSAMLLSDLILRGKSPWQDVFNPLRQGASLTTTNKFFTAQQNVRSQPIDNQPSTTPINLKVKPGEGKILTINEQRIGIYRDEKGQLHIVDTTCAHLGCEVSWNSAEKTWDCPCHGSRYSYDGDVIEGPTVKPLDIPQNLNHIEKMIEDK